MCQTNMKTLKPKVLLIFMLFIITVLVIAGCSNNADDKEDSDGVATVEFAGFDEDGHNQDKIDRFNDNHDDIQVEYTEMEPTTDDQYTQFSTWLSAENDTPEILMVDSQFISQFASSNWLHPIDEYVDEEYLERFWPAAVDAGEYEDELFGIQARMDVGMMYYREDLLDEYNQPVPETWDDLVSVSKAIQKEEENEDLNGYLFQGGQIEGVVINWLETLWGRGGEVETSDGEFVVNSDEGVQALEKLRDLVYEDKISPESVSTANPDDNNKLFGQGNAIFQRNWTFAFESLNDTEVEGKYGITNIPSFDENDKGHASNGERVYTINPFSEHKDEAWEVIEYFLSDEEQEKMVSDAGYVPSVESVTEDPDVQEEQPIMEDMQEIIEESKNRPKIRNYGQFSNILQPHLNAVIADENVDPKKELDKAQQEIDEKIN